MVSRGLPPHPSAAIPHVQTLNVNTFCDGGGKGKSIAEHNPVCTECLTEVFPAGVTGE